MPINNPLLGLFKEQLEGECDALATKYGLTERGDYLIYWYFIRLHDFTASGVDEILCDGTGDLGIDALWIDDDAFVHFFSFKNPIDRDKAYGGGDVDKTIAGLLAILQKNHSTIANPELAARLDEVYQQVPQGYRIHFVTSGAGLSAESIVKLDSFVAELKGPSANIVSWEQEPLASLQDRFYQQNLPAVDTPLVFPLPRAPYMLRSGVADCYLFHVEGQMLAALYHTHGESLLQRNIRVDQRDTATNRSIEGTCSSESSSNFLHFNNGVTFLCDSASYEPFQGTLKLIKAQVVNGGQTIRALHRASAKTSLKPDVLVPARAITSSGDKDFANDVAVNQNNQNRVGTSFLRSNDPIVIQLDHALAARGWFLERREGELKTATDDELATIEKRVGGPVTGRTIRLKEGAQAYTATFSQEPELAKKNPQRIFLSVNDGGSYEKIFSNEMTAEKLIVAHQIKTVVDGFVRKFNAIRRKLQASDNVREAYEPVVGADLASEHADVIHQVVPQCSLFLCGTLYKDVVSLKGEDFTTLPALLAQDGQQLIREHLVHIIEFAKNNKDKADKSWPVLLKSNAFFRNVTSDLEAKRQQSETPG